MFMDRHIMGERYPQQLTAASRISLTPSPNGFASVIQSVSKSVGQSFSQSVSQSLSQSVSRSVSLFGTLFTTRYFPIKVTPSFSL